MTDVEHAIQEFEDNAYHPSMKPEISIESKAVALAALKEKQVMGKGCEHCNGSPRSSPLYHWLNAGYKNCPYCGRNLTGGAK